MKPISMHLFREGEKPTAELGRKRYEELKKDLEERGLREAEFAKYKIDDDGILISTEKRKFFSFNEVRHYTTERHGPLLKYNPPLLSAIAGQRPEGVGSIYVDNARGKLFKFIREDEEGRIWLDQIKGMIFNISRTSFNYDHHLATIEELIAAFPNENAQVEPEPRKINVGDWLECVEAHNALTKGRVYKATNHNGENCVQVLNDNGNLSYYSETCFAIAIANEEEPVKEERDWEEQTTIYLRTKDEALELEITPEGIFLRNVVTPNITDFLRYALQRHDQLKQQ